MEGDQQRRRGPTPTRSLREIVAVALALADDSGLAGVTIRATADAAQLAPAALYRYLPSRDALVEHLVDRALEDLVFPVATGDRVADLVALAAAQVAVIRRHPWLVDALTAVRPGPAAIRMLEEGLRALEGSPASGAVKLELLAMVTGVATLLGRSSVAPPSGTIEALQAAAATHPNLAAAFAAPGAASSSDELLERVVGSLVGGLLA